MQVIAFALAWRVLDELAGSLLATRHGRGVGLRWVT
jgi:hypothetical protein